MDSRRWELAAELFDLVVDRASAERTELLNTRCSEDHDLRQMVESLLDGHDRAPADFMEPPPIDPDSTLIIIPDPSDEPTLPDGTKIGPFTVRSVIACGGMGVVYLAEQSTPQRQVAVKIIREGITSRSAMRRFELEGLTLAQLRHPHIAQVYQTGMAATQGPKSTPYFAMEYIPQASSITDYAAQSSLSIADRLKLFVQVCDAVQHGHRKGIIHRDLKPSNILVDEAGYVKVIDFGVARSTDSDVAVTTMLTDAGQLVGTLRYMSPEQCVAEPSDLDTRSDVYSLGVVLYELLCGRLPYDVGSSVIHAAARVICEQPAVRPSSINRKLRGDLQTIVLTALEKDRSRRYQSAADLADDIRRYLNREPIEARPPTAWTCLLRWAIRHPAAATLTTCLTIAAIVAMASGLSIWYANSRPHRLKIVSGNEVRLETWAGRYLRTWNAGAEDSFGIRFVHPDLIDRPQHMGGGRLAILGFAHARNLPRPNALEVYNVDCSWTQPEWSRKLSPGDSMPDPHNREYSASNFYVHSGRVLDVFPELPGPEIIVAFTASNVTQTILRIYDLEGALLYEIWHDALIDDIRFIPSAGLLVCAGIDGFWKWKELRDIPNIDSPRVVFALRPHPGEIQDKFLRITPGEDPTDPAWYFVMLPPEAKMIKLSAPWLGDLDAAVAVSLCLEYDCGCTITWDLDSQGVPIENSQFVGESLVSTAEQLAKRDTLRLVPFGSVVPPELLAKRAEQLHTGTP